MVAYTQVAAIQQYDYTESYGTQFGTFPNWLQSGGDSLIQVTTGTGSTRFFFYIPPMYTL